MWPPTCPHLCAPCWGKDSLCHPHDLGGAQGSHAAKLGIPRNLSAPSILDTQDVLVGLYLLQRDCIHDYHHVLGGTHECQLAAIPTEREGVGAQVGILAQTPATSKKEAGGQLGGKVAPGGHSLPQSQAGLTATARGEWCQHQWALVQWPQEELTPVGTLTCWPGTRAVYLLPRQARHRPLLTSSGA